MHQRNAESSGVNSSQQGQGHGQGEPSSKSSRHVSNVKDNRDPRGINSDITVMFNDVIAEPDDDMYTADSCWLLSGEVYSCSRRWCYRILTFILALPLAVCWGCCFSCLGFYRIWCWVPCIRVIEVNSWPIRRYVEIWVGVCLRPMYQAMGLVFSSINITHRQGSINTV